MAINFRFTGSMEGMVASLRRLEVDVREKALVRSLNKMADQIKTATAREIRAVGYNLKTGDIKKALTKINASPNRLNSAVRASGRPVPLVKYGARKTNRGVSVKVLNGRKLIQSAFMAVMPNGHVGVYKRAGMGHKKIVKNGRVVWSGLPIKELYGPSVPDGMSNKIVQAAIDRLVVEKFPAILSNQINFFSR